MSYVLMYYYWLGSRLLLPLLLYTNVIEFTRKIRVGYNLSDLDYISTYLV
jgi:hypothetical protein